MKRKFVNNIIENHDFINLPEDVQQLGVLTSFDDVHQFRQVVCGVLQDDLLASEAHYQLCPEFSIVFDFPAIGPHSSPTTSSQRVGRFALQPSHVARVAHSGVRHSHEGDPKQGS